MTNPFIAPFLQRLEHRYSRDYLDMPYSEWIKANTSLRGKQFDFSRYPFQVDIVNDMHPNMDVRKCSQVGLALALNTPIPTPSGWTTMGDLQVGDRVFDELGTPCEVRYVSPVYLDHVCYKVTFDDGQEIVADADHKWAVDSFRPFDVTGTYAGVGNPGKGITTFKSGILTTQQIAKFHKAGERNRFAIHNTQPLDLPEAPLPVDPYFLGLHLGDGNSHACCLTAHENDYPFYQEELRRRGMTCVPSSKKGQAVQFLVHLLDQTNRPGRGVKNSLSSKLSALGMLRGSKFVPPQYLRASEEQRLDLLRGLLDTDGSITRNGRVSFHNTDPGLVEAVEDIASSLGLKTRTRWRMGKPSTLKSGHIITPKKPIAEVSFVSYSEGSVFLLPRKKERLRSTRKGHPKEALQRRIVQVVEVPSVPVRCISVSSSSHLYLAGRGMIPTHNTEVQIRKILSFLVRNRGTRAIFTLPNELLMEKVSQTRIKPIVEKDRAFNSEGDRGAVRSKTIMQFGESFLYVTGCSEADATSTSADAVFNDEVDLSPQNMLALFNSRLQDSDWKINQRFSTPTFPAFGIDLSFSISDQRVYKVKCDGCNHWSVPEFNRNHIVIPGLPDHIEVLTEIDDTVLDSLDLDNAHVCCEKCRRPLDLGRTDNRQWVATYPGRTRARGYDVTPFCTGRLSVGYIVDQLIKYKKRDYMRGFHNTVLGRAWADGNIRLEESAIRACMSTLAAVPPVGDDVPVRIGIDMGNTCYLVAGTGDPKKRNCAPFLWEAVPVNKIVERVMELCDTYNVVGGTCDRHPFTPTADEIFEKTKGKVIPVEYRGAAEVNLVKDKFGRLSHAQVNRTIHIDDAAAAVRKRHLSISGYSHYKEIIVEHLRDMVRDESPEKEAVWTKLTGNDHFFHALAFFLATYKVMDLIDELDDSDPRAMNMFSVVDLQKNKDALSGKYFDSDKLGTHNRPQIIGIF